MKDRERNGLQRMQVHFTTVLNTCPQTSEFLHKETTMQKPIWKKSVKIKIENSKQYSKGEKYQVSCKSKRWVIFNKLKQIFGGAHSVQISYVHQYKLHTT